MSTIRVGGGPDPASVEAVAVAVVRVIEACAEAGFDRDESCAALAILSGAISAPTSAAITDCTFYASGAEPVDEKEGA